MGKVDSKEDFIKLIDEGGDIMFDCSDKHYTILTWWDDGIFIGEQITADQPEDKHEVFLCAQDLVHSFLVNGEPLETLLSDVVITFYS
ncbi:MAG: hypothetical protein QM689_03340 [Oscillospiraceae bacterium]